MQIPSFEFQPGGDRLLVSLGSYASVWNLAAPESFERIDLGVIVEHAAWGPDGELAAGGSDGSIVVWNRDLERIAELKAPAPVRFVAFDPSGKRLVSSGSVDLRAVVWDLERLEPMLRLKHPGWADWKDFISSARFSPDGNGLVTTTSTWASVAAWNARSGERLWFVDFYGGNPLRSDAFFDARGRHVFVRGYTHRILDAGTGAELAAPERPRSGLGATPDGRFAFTRRGDGIEVWDGDALEPLFTYVPCEAGAWRVDRHPPPDGRR
jgi:WD40 repeat protein